ncbi:MAG: NAD(P)/FAD-dependent oxidoreductase, partial [Coriobacteriales bacterium]
MNGVQYDAIVIGGGPAGLTAALYLARARNRVLVLEKEQFGGQIALTAEIVNYPGVEKTSGAELTSTMRKQAEAFGAECRKADVTSLDLDGDVKTVHTSAGDFTALSVLLATGTLARQAGFEGEEKFRGHGVTYC